MKRFVLATVLSVASLVLSPLSLGKSPDSEGGSRPTLEVGVVDMQAAILQTKEGQEARKLIQLEVEAKKASLLEKQKELEAMEKQFLAQQAMLSDQVKKEKHEAFTKKLEELRSAQLSFEQEVRMKENRATQEILGKISSIIEEMAKRMKLQFVFEKGSNTLLYAEKAKDITLAVVDEYNARHKPAKTSEAKKGKTAN